MRIQLINMSVFERFASYYKLYIQNTSKVFMQSITVLNVQKKPQYVHFYTYVHICS